MENGTLGYRKALPMSIVSAKTKFMKQTVFRFGTYSALFIIIFFALTWMIFGNSVEKNYETQEVVGYLGIFLATSFAFFGIKHYRDKVNAGQLTFGQGLKVGLLIVLIAALAFAVVDLVYVLFINPDFFENYYNYQVSQMKVSMTPDHFAEQLKEMESQKKIMSNPAVLFVLMFFTVVVIGLIVSVVSALILKKV